MQTILLVIFMCIVLVLTIITLVLQVIGLTMYIVKFRGQGVRQNIKARTLPQASMLIHTSLELNVVVLILGAILVHILQRLR